MHIRRFPAREIRRGKMGEAGKNRAGEGKTGFALIL
jgi:hypothetical protein